MGINITLAVVVMGLLLLTLPAAASDCTLGIFGNANEDETINMQDVTYTELIILEYRDRTELADGKHDGKINMQDVTQIELVILGQEKELTFLDIFGEAETVNKPIERLANLGYWGTQVTRALGARDIIVAIGNQNLKTKETFYPEISKLPAVGPEPDSCDFEMVLSLKPDAVQTNLEANWAVTAGGLEKKRMFEEKLQNIPIICLNMREPDVLSENVRIYGYILDREDEAEEFIDWFEGQVNTIKSRTEELSEDEKPRSYFENINPYRCVASGSRFGQGLLLSGGKNVVDEIVGPDDPQYGTISVAVDPEWVIVQNPEYIFKRGRYHGSTSYETDDPSAFATERQEVLDRPELANVDAVKDRCVYVLDNNLMSGAGNTIIGTAYMAKVLHPNLFEDIDPHAIHQEYVDQFCYIDFDVKEHGVFVYPPLEGS